MQRPLPLEDRPHPDGLVASVRRRTRASRSAALELFELLERLRPIALEQPRETAVGEELSASLTTRAIVRLIVGVADALHRIAAARAGLAKAPVHYHSFSKRSNALRERGAGFGLQPIDPELQRCARSLVEAFPFVGSELLRLRDRRQ